MRLTNFEIDEPLPVLNAPHVIAVLRPWLDAGSTGTLILRRLSARFGAKELARLAKPGNFYDFTRYRPMTHFKGNTRELTIPNTTISYARSETGNDFLFLRMLEPHMLGETYADSVWQILKRLEIRRYCLIGSFYDVVPHTRPIMLSGSASGKSLSADLSGLGIVQSRYEGPTTICNVISEKAEKAKIETLTLLVHLPHYIELEEDYIGMTALLQVLRSLYDIPISDSDRQTAAAQLASMDAAVGKDRKLKALLTELESMYDAQSEAGKKEKEVRLSPEIDKFLKEMENRFKEP